MFLQSLSHKKTEWTGNQRGLATQAAGQIVEQSFGGKSWEFPSHAGLQGARRAVSGMWGGCLVWEPGDQSRLNPGTSSSNGFTVST